MAAIDLRPCADCRAAGKPKKGCKRCRWRARWREADGRQRAKHFERKVDAESWLAKVRVALDGGTYQPPERTRVTFGAYLETWLTRMAPTWRPRSRDTIEQSLRLHALPVFGPRPMRSITRADVEAWLRSLDLAPGTVRSARQRLSSVFIAALDDGLIDRNPCAGAKSPRVERPPVRPLTREQLDALTAAAPEWLRIALVLGAGAGLRLGEALGLTIDRVDFLRRTITVDRQMVTISGHAPAFAPVKTPSSVRQIPVASFVVDSIAAHVKAHGTGRDGLIVHQGGEPVRRQRFNDAWRRTRSTSGVEARFHDLRHTFASVLLANGTNIRAVASYLGHASPTITLSTYAHLMPDDADRAREVIERVLGPATGEDQVRTRSADR